MAKYANLYINQYEDFEVQVELEDIASDVFDISGYELYGKIKKTYQSATSFDIDITVIDSETAKFELRLGSETTSVMKPGRYLYDVFAYNSNSDRKFKLIEGQAEIIPSVTNLET